MQCTVYTPFVRDKALIGDGASRLFETIKEVNSELLKSFLRICSRRLFRTGQGFN